MPSKRKKNKRRMRRVQAQRRALEEQHVICAPAKATQRVAVSAAPSATQKKEEKIEVSQPLDVAPTAVPKEEATVVELQLAVTEPVEPPVPCEPETEVLQEIPAEVEVAEKAPVFPTPPTEPAKAEPEAEVTSPADTPEEAGADETVEPCDPEAEAQEQQEEEVEGTVEPLRETQEIAVCTATEPATVTSAEHQAAVSTEEEAPVGVEEETNILRPEVSQPEVSEPKETEPEVSEPKETEPEVSEPKETEPEVSEPKETEPEVSEPKETEPEVSEAIETEPEVSEPKDSEPEVSEAKDTEPELSEPKETEPEVSEPEKAPEESEEAIPESKEDGADKLAGDFVVTEAVSVLDGAEPAAERSDTMDAEPADETHAEPQPAEEPIAETNVNLKCETYELPYQTQLPVESLSLSSMEVSVETVLNGHIASEVTIEG
ncbi:uncharacterized protein LOC128762618 isoform X2 [Synchiropus splendidus]|uniref:uncharacterized protein LOC128762618 isoform X2 n=1 Tax=Synchiropus splendidus TaxID=270530 RepID=UPI00237E93EF|nr:uncharacterized protein LOC128762618 isoform X2 [Synchiropus splendidus]